MLEELTYRSQEGATVNILTFKIKLIRIVVWGEKYYRKDSLENKNTFVETLENLPRTGW